MSPKPKRMPLEPDWPAIETRLRAIASGERLTSALLTLREVVHKENVELILDKADPGWWQRKKADAHGHFKNVANLGSSLREALRHERPLWNTASVDWSTFDPALDTIVDSAQRTARAYAPTKGARRPPLAWRDSLIAVVRSLYAGDLPEEADRYSHFVDTVRSLLQSLDRDVENIRKVIADALRRQPTPPFVVTPKTEIRH